MLLLEDRRHYVYAHSKATSGEIFYIGKGSRCRAYDVKRRSAWHKSVVLAHGVDVRILEAHLTAKEAFSREVELIAESKPLGLELVNLTDGGDGLHGVRQETRARMSYAAKNRPPITEDSRAKMRTASSAREWSAETNAKRATALTGKRHAHTAETKAKMSATRKGRSHSPGHSAAISVAKKLYYAARRAAQG